MNKKRLIIVIVLIIITVTIAGLYTTYALDVTEEDKTSEYDYGFKFEFLENEEKQVTIPAGETKLFDIDITNPYSDTIRYGIAYRLISLSTMPTGVIIEESAMSPSPTMGTIDANKTLSSTIVVINESTESITLSFSVINGYKNDSDLTGNSASAGKTFVKPLERQAYKTLEKLGLADEIKTDELDFNLTSPINIYGEDIAINQSVSYSSNILGNKTIGTGYEFDKHFNTFSLTGVSENQSYNNAAVGKYTCNSTSSTGCTTIYKINAVNDSGAITDYSEAAPTTYTSTLTSSANRTVGSTYTFDGTYYQLAGTIVSNVSYGTDYINYYTCNNNTGVNCTYMYKIETVSDTSVTQSQYYSRTTNYNYITNVDTYTLSLKSYDYSNVGIYSMEDDLGTSYYFRGNVENNYVYFAGFYWRILRINGDGSIRIIYDGTSAHANGESSTDRGIGDYKFSSSLDYSDSSNVVKGVLNEWYEENISNKWYEWFVNDTQFCNAYYDSYSSSSSCQGTNGTSNYYNRYHTLYSNNYKTGYIVPTASLKCDSSYMYSQKNGKLTYPIGLITADEAVLAGAVFNRSLANNQFYLYIGNTFVTMTPSKKVFQYYRFSSTLYGCLNVPYLFGVSNTGTGTTVVANSTLPIRPVISLKPNVIIDGTGSMDNPFIVEYY